MRSRLPRQFHLFHQFHLSHQFHLPLLGRPFRLPRLSRLRPLVLLDLLILLDRSLRQPRPDPGLHWALLDLQAATIHSSMLGILTQKRHSRVVHRSQIRTPGDQRSSGLRKRSSPLDPWAHHPHPHRSRSNPLGRRQSSVGLVESPRRSFWYSSW